MASICFVAGDPSGDAHAGHLATALRARRPDLVMTGLGGPAMRQAGVELLDELTRAAAIGPFDAARHARHLIRARHRLEDHLRTAHPQLVVLVDFGDFNLPVIAPLVKRYGVPILYYISPQIWAWGRFRLRYVRRYVDRMCVFFRFEEALYRREGVPVTWVGHPLIDAARPTLGPEDARRRFGLNPWRMTLGVLPGSREGEVRRHLPIMLEAVRLVSWQMPGVQSVLLKAPGVPPNAFARAARGRLELQIADGSPYEVLPLLDAAIVSSGTATLEAALFDVPMAVVYRTSWPTYLAARTVLRIPHIAMVNVIAQRQVVPEFIQHRAKPELIAASIVELLRQPERRALMQTDLRQVAKTLGPSGAVERAADVALAMLR